MSAYFELKTAHVIWACVLLALATWSLWPLRSCEFNRSFKGMLWVIPVGVVQAILGMATLSIEPGHVPSYETAVLIGGMLLLGLLWLIGLAGVKILALNPGLQLRKIQTAFAVWISLLVLIFLVMLYLMTNFTR